MEYRDMVIEASNVQRKMVDGVWQRSFTVRVLSSPKGEMSAEQAAPVAYPEPPLQANLKRLEVRDLGQAGLVELGRQLALLLLPPDAAPVSVRELFKDNLKGLGPDEGLRLRLQLPPALASVPWEYMYVDRAGGGDGMDGFLALDPRVAIVRHEPLNAPSDQPPLEDDIKVVVALASAPDLEPLDLKQELQDLQQVFSGQAGIKPTFLQDATLDQVQAAIPSAGIFHFAGHGVFERKMTDLPGVYTGEGALALFDQIAPAEQLGINLRGNGVRLAVLGGCETGRREGMSVWSGIAPALIKAEIPAVIGNQFKISDECAIAFSKQLYQALVGGLPIERAVAAGRIAAYNADKTGRDWGVPVLYMRAGDGRLFAGAGDPVARQAARQAAEVKVNIEVHGNLTIQSTVNQVETKIVQGDYVDRQTIIQNVLVLGPDALDQIVQKLAAMQGLDKQVVRQPSDEALPENVSRQIAEVVAAQKEAAAKGMPVSAESAYQLGLMAMSKRDYEGALAYFRQATEADPDYSDAFESIAWVQHTQAMDELIRQNYDAAVADLADARNAIMHADPADVQTLVLRGYISKSLGQIADERKQIADRDKYCKEATHFFEAALKLSPDDASTQNGLANVQHMLGNLDAAIAAYRRAIELAPDYTAAWNDLAAAYEDKARTDRKHAQEWRRKALEAWKKMYELAPDDPSFSPEYIVQIGQRIHWLERGGSD